VGFCKQNDFFAGHTGEHDLRSLTRRLLMGSPFRGLSLRAAEAIIQTTRVRTVEEKPPIYLERLTALREKFLERLSAVISPILGTNYPGVSLHEIADIATELNVKISAFLGKFEAINLKFGSPSDPEVHSLDGVE
jgi:hypothetical protein